VIELLCTDYNKKATFIHYYLNNAVLGGAMGIWDWLQCLCGVLSE